jgi:two-component system sensor histidine kinase/response regulator
MSAHWDHAVALRRLEGDETLLQELIAIFFAEYPDLSNRLQQALARGDLKTASETAHSLKGSLGYVGFSVAAELAWEVENAVRRKNAVEATQFASALTMEIEVVRQTIGLTGT